MTDRKDFLYSFSDALKLRLTRTASVGLSVVFQNFSFHEDYSYDDALAKLEEMKLVLDKVLSILYNPHILVKTNEIILRSELSGKLSQQSFEETMRDPQLWKEKRGAMVPEYVHTVETIDSIQTYENRFIALLIDEMDEQIDEILSELNPLMESIEEHYQHREMTFGTYSPFHDLRNKTYPYASFFLSANHNKDAVYNLARRIKRKTKNMKSTEFYKLNCKPKLSKNVRPTNILIHDKLYSFCYRYHIENFRKSKGEDKKRSIAYFNYFTASLLKCFSDLKLIDEVPLSMDTLNQLTFEKFTFSHYPFLFTLNENKEEMVLEFSIQVTDGEKEVSSTKAALIVRDRYKEENEKSIEALKKRYEEEGYSLVLLATMNNLVKEIDGVMTFTYYKDDNDVLLGDLLTSMTILFEADKELYQNFCPVCGHTQIHVEEHLCTCENCRSTYTMFPLEEKNLLWVRSYRKE